MNSVALLLSCNLLTCRLLPYSASTIWAPSTVTLLDWSYSDFINTLSLSLSHIRTQTLTSTSRDRQHTAQLLITTTTTFKPSLCCMGHLNPFITKLNFPFTPHNLQEPHRCLREETGDPHCYTNTSANMWHVNKHSNSPDGHWLTHEVQLFALFRKLIPKSSCPH